MDPWLWSVFLLFLAVVFIFLEVLIPSGGVLGFLAAVSVIASVAVAFSDGMATGGVMLTVAMIVIPISIAMVVKYWPETPMGRLIMLQPPAGDDAVLPDTPEYREVKLLVGRSGVARTKMLPCGSISIDSRLYDAVSDGIAIEPGQPIYVVAIRNNRILVRPDDRLPTTTAANPADLLSQPAELLGLDPSRNSLM